MTHLLDKSSLAADDVLCIPRSSHVLSRSTVETGAFIYSAPMDRVTGYALTKELVNLGHCAVVCRTLPKSEWLLTLKEFASNPRVFFAIGLCRDQLKILVDTLLELNIERPINLAIDVAHGDMNQAHKLASYLKELGICRYIMSGSICTTSAAIRAVKAGCTHLRVGVGPGSVCTTRQMTGCGFPQLSAVYNIAKYVKADVHVIADGGIRNPGDVVKYLSAGATGVMMGSALAATLEAPGWIHTGFEELDTSAPVTFPMAEPKPIYQKSYRGQASASFMRDNGKSHNCAEGEERLMTWDQTVLKDVVRKYEAGVASGCSYLGCNRVEDLNPRTVEMVRITTNALIEGRTQ